MLLKAPFLMPPGWVRYFGYTGPRRFVALYWSPCGDEACFSDGQTTRTGADHWLFLDLVRHPSVRRWLDDNAILLGNCEQDAEHWLIVDVTTNEVFAAPRTDARFFVSFQTVPGLV